MKCGKLVSAPGTYQYFKCGKKAKVEINGEHYCGTHDPNKKKTKAQINASVRYRKEAAGREYAYDCRDLILKLAEAGNADALALVNNYRTVLKNLEAEVIE